MSKDFVETVRIENFGCVRDAQLELTPLHALIGPNDSGKSTVLGALGIVGKFIASRHQLGGSDPRGRVGSKITVRSGSTELVVTRRGPDWERDLTRRDVLTLTGGVVLVRWEPDAIRRPCDLIPEGTPLTLGEKGEGIAAIYEAILSRDRAAFAGIEAGVQSHFPTVKGLWLPTSAGSKKALGVLLEDGTRVHADEMSEGLLYWLAFAVLPHIAPTAILLIEEPENGLHPSRIADVMSALRAVSERMQVIIATHSPLVINELEPEEVTILTRDPASGTRATRIDRTSHFQQRQRVYALGELWLSFADGVDETALVPSEQASKSAG